MPVAFTEVLEVSEHKTYDFLKLATHHNFTSYNAAKWFEVAMRNG